MDKRSGGRIPWAIVLLIVAFVCAMAFGAASLYRAVFAAETFGRVKQPDVGNVESLQTESRGFVYYDGSAVSSISSTGRTRWSYLVGANAGFAATDYGVAAWVGRTVTLIDSESGNTTYNGAMAGDVLDARVGQTYTAVLVGPTSDSSIVVMENGGKQVNNISLEQLTAVDFGFFSNGSLLWVMVCDSNGTVPTCSIKTYRPGKEIVGSITDTEQLMYAVMFQSAQVRVAGDTYLKTYDYTGTEDVSRRTLVYGWYLAAFDHNSADPLMAFVIDAQYAGNSQIQDVRMIGAGVDQTVRMPFGCTSVVAEGNSVYGFAADGHIMVATAGSEKVASYQIGIAIDKVYGVTADGVAVVGNAGSIYLVNLV